MPGLNLKQLQLKSAHTLPCALGLATPMSIMVGAGRGAQGGVLIRNAEALETLGKVDFLVVDNGHPHRR